MLLSRGANAPHKSALPDRSVLIGLRGMISTGTGYITTGTCKNKSVIASTSRLRTEVGRTRGRPTVKRIDKTPPHRTD